jgi:hypothetical protein
MESKKEFTSKASMILFRSFLSCCSQQKVEVFQTQARILSSIRELDKDSAFVDQTSWWTKGIQNVQRVHGSGSEKKLAMKGWDRNGSIE